MKTIAKYVLQIFFFLPFIAGAQVPTSYDSDGDGIPDSVDKCVLVKGTAQFHGCPYELKITADDRDGDGVANAEDQCPDLFGVAANKGCPCIGSDKACNKPADFGDKADVVVPAHATMYANTWNSADIAQVDFKDKLESLLGSAGLLFHDIKMTKDKDNDKKSTTSMCLPGAKECYVITDAKTFFYASYGSFKSGEEAASKCADLKQKLHASLGETDWQYADVASGYVEEYKASKKAADGNCLGSVTTYVQKSADTYNVYVTVEGKNSCGIASK